MIFLNTVVCDRYRADMLLGRGGMGEVWKCFDMLLGRYVVLKVVTQELAKARPHHTEIFIDEAKIGASLVGHPNVVTVFDVINKQNGDQPILAIVMEFVEGMSCADWINSNSLSLDLETKYYISLQMALEVCRALHYAHRHNILHRDIKPHNIFISKYGMTKIGDFGLARYADALTREHTVVNFRSPAYCAPEQWNDEKAVRKTDTYQLGCSLYQLFTGELPFQSLNAVGLLQKHLNEAPRNPRDLNSLLSEEVSAMLLRCLAKKSSERPPLWELIDVIAKEVQHDYRMLIELDKNDSDLIERVKGITEFNDDTLKKKGSFTTEYVDYNEAISEAIGLILLGGVNVALKKVLPVAAKKASPKS